MHTATLEELEAQMSRLLSTRNAAIKAAEDLIAQANRDFDAVALPLGREINAVRRAIEAQKPRPEPAQKSAPRARKQRVLAGLDEDEQAYFQQLRQKARR